MYVWHELSLPQREEALRQRRQCGYPWHGPPHFQTDLPRFYHLSAACYEHSPIVGRSPERMAVFEAELVEVLEEGGNGIPPEGGTTNAGAASPNRIPPEGGTTSAGVCSPGFSRNPRIASQLRAWCVLPNHWHALVRTGDLKALTKQIGRLHGRTARQWNQEEAQEGRKCWFRCGDRHMRSEAHFWATLNYVHHNPVHHGYVRRWQDWPYSSAAGWLEKIGASEAQRLWEQYPVLDYGKGWDDVGRFVQ